MMKMPELFENIGRRAKRKSVKGLAKKLSKKFNPDNPEVLENICKLAYLLYVYEETDAAREVIDLIKDKPFEGSFDQWTWVDMTLALDSRMNNGTTRSSYQNTIRDVLASGTDLHRKVNKKNFDRFMSGETLDYEGIAEAVEDGDKEIEWDYRLAQLMMLVKLKELGGSDVFPEKKAETEILENLVILRDLSF